MGCFSILGHKNELVVTLEQVLSDDSFKIRAPPTIEARESAERLLQWCITNANSALLTEFTEKLTDSMNMVIKASLRKSFKYNYDKLWKKFFQLRSSPDFSKRWSNFLTGTGQSVKPLLFQHLTDLVFRKCLDDHFKILQLDQESETDVELRDTEKGVVRYIAGFICRQLKRKLERESHEFKEELILCLVELVKHNEECGTDEEWTDLLDRGGLVHVKETTYRFFHAMECVVKENLRRLTKPSAPSKVEVIQRTTDDDDVQFYWLIVTADFEIDVQEVHKTLLWKIVELYVTVRGFSLANGWVEKYKQRTKVATQKTKSLRRDLHDGT